MKEVASIRSIHSCIWILIYFILSIFIVKKICNDAFFTCYWLTQMGLIVIVTRAKSGQIHAHMHTRIHTQSNKNPKKEGVTKNKTKRGRREKKKRKGRV